jgi:protein-tyrosine phosphatase
VGWTAASPIVSAHVIDLHCHVLPGIDDGPTTIEESIALARAAAAAGTRTIVATPHVSWRYPNRAETIVRLTRELGERLRAEGVPVEIRPGAEIAMTRAADVDRAELPHLGLGGGPWLLLEPPFTPLAGGLDAIVIGLQSSNHRIVLAHPERCPAFHRDPGALRSLVRAGALTSITAGSLVGRFGGEVRRFALNMVAEELVHNVASDAHDTVRRPPGIAAELERAGLGPLTDWLALGVPAAILSGEPIPPRPAFAVPRMEGRLRRMWSRHR